MRNTTLLMLAPLALLGCQPQSTPSTNLDAIHPKTVELNQQVHQTLKIKDQQDFIDANRGLIAKAPLTPIKNSAGDILWDNGAYQFVKGQAPNSVNPSLWRQATLNNIRGLFEVTPGIYQLRGFDFANMTIIESDGGWIIVDPLTAKETSANALAFAQQHLGKKPIKAVILTHAHMDHFGGVLGVVSPEEVAANNIEIIAPFGFVEAATSENIIAGVAMARRSAFMYGKALPRSEVGHVGSGLGTGPAYGTFGIMTPTITIQEDMSALKVDGVDFIFQNASGTESVAEITFYLPQFKAFGGAELVSRNMHNLYTLRGAQIRDALAWSAKIDQARIEFDQAQLYFGSHHWPIWGQQNVQSFLSNQRDMYKYLHDQTVRMLNQGLNGDEIAEKITLPAALANNFYNRGYYGSVSHNSKAIYQFYMGWFDANPAHLNPLPKADSAQRYVALAGGEEKLFNHAKQAYQHGEFRWAAELLNHLVFANETNQQAKQLLANTYRQLGYQSEAASWRNFYLKGAQELLNGVSEKGIDLSLMKDILLNTDVDKFFTSMAVRLNSDKAAGKAQTIKIEFTDLAQSYYLVLNNSVLRHYSSDELSVGEQEISATLSVTRALFVDMLVGDVGIKNTLFSDQLSIDGSTLDLISFLLLFDKPNSQFNIVTP